MDPSLESRLRDELLDRREKLVGVIGDVGSAPDLVRLLKEVDSALSRMDSRTFGRCQVCKEAVDDDFLSTNPLIQYCLCNLTPAQLQALQNDLDLAYQIQLALLPKQDLTHAGWQIHHRYEPAGPVSGDYCDVVTCDGGNLFFLLGDVSGKGVAASFLMARLNALFRSLIDVGPPLQEIVERANRLFSENTVTSHYATLVCGRASPSGEIEICNAGHCPPLVVSRGEATPVGSTGFPVGIFAKGPYSVQKVRLSPGDTLFLYTDGLTEARDPNDREYGLDRLSGFLRSRSGRTGRALAAECLADLASFLGGAPRTDDLTLMVVRRGS